MRIGIGRKTTVIGANVRNLPDMRTRRTRRAVSACLLLATMAWLQLSIAEHQFDHEFGETGQYCETCAQFDRLDDVVVDKTPDAVYAAPAASQPPVLTVSRSSQRPARLNARGPPAS